VFPHCGLVHVTGGDTILLASARPLDADPHAVASFQCFVNATPQIQADLKKFFGVNQATELLLQYYGPDEQGLAEFVARGGSPQLNTDINMRLEFDAPLRLFGRNPAEAEMLPTALVALRDQAWLERLAQKMGIQRDTALYHWMLGNQALAEKRTSDATPLLRRAIAQDPSLAVAYRDLAEASIANHDDATAIDAMTSLLPLAPDNAEVRASLAGLLARKKEYRRATELLRESLRLDSSSVIVQMNLAWVLATAPDPDIRDGSQAVALGEQACAATNYQDAYCLDALAAALAEAGDFERAIHLASEAARQLRLLGEPTHMVEQRLALYYRRQAYHEE
jgi:tetratricopeptide (TPR) repeat protein